MLCTVNFRSAGWMVGSGLIVSHFKNVLCTLTLSSVLLLCARVQLSPCSLQRTNSLLVTKNSRVSDVHMITDDAKQKHFPEVVMTTDSKNKTICDAVAFSHDTPLSMK